MADGPFPRTGQTDQPTDQPTDLPQKNFGKTDVSENEKGRNRLATNLSFYRSYGFFARTPGNPRVRRDVGTSPKKFATDLKTKVVRLEKLVIKSVDPVDGGRSVSARGSIRGRKFDTPALVKI